MKQVNNGVSRLDALELMHHHEAEQRLEAFVRESNRIEGIHRDPTPAEIKTHKTFIARKRVKIEHVTQLVAVCQPNAVLRATSDVPGVRARGTVPRLPKGSPRMRPAMTGAWWRLLAGSSGLRCTADGFEPMD